MNCRAAGAVALATVLWASISWAEDEPKAPLFAEPKQDWAWDEDKRFDFLMERLASLEASLDAVDSALAKASGKRGAKLGDARRAEANNSMMDRKGGGPMKWNEFYGTTAEKFFYHPVDPNTTYHTSTALRQMGTSQDDKVGNGVPSSQSVPVHQRPPQFDYIYRANRDAKAKAEEDAKAIAGKIEDLSRRKYELEKEQAELWCMLAFRAIQKANIPRKPLLRFRLVSATTDPADIQRAEAISAAARFLAIALLIIEKADDDQAAAFGNVKTLVTNARNDFDDGLLNADAIAEEIQDKQTTVGKYVALAQLLDDTANNLSDSHEVATEGDEAKDLARKDRFRGLLQRSLVEYSQIILALDELLGIMKKDWKISVDTKNKAIPVEVSWEASRVAPVQPSIIPEVKPAPPFPPKPKPKPEPKAQKMPRNGKYVFLFSSQPSSPFLGLLVEVKGNQLWIHGDAMRPSEKHPNGVNLWPNPSLQTWQDQEGFKVEGGKVMTDVRPWALTWDLDSGEATRFLKESKQTQRGKIIPGGW